MTHKLSASQKVDIINAFTIELEPMIQIAERYGKTRQAIWKMLKKEGVDVSNGLGNTRIIVSCTACNKTMECYRSRVRKQVHHFCNDECYYAYLEAGNGHGPYIQSRHGQRIARSKVKTVFNVKDEHVVHHEDRNNYNNMWSNLRVFACQGDHIRYHRLGIEYAQPIWTGEGTVCTMGI
jgi:hypothetical protein